MAAARRRQLLDDEFLATLNTLNLSARMPINNRFAGVHRSKTYGGISEFADYREYQPGDDLRRIDWNLAGRTGQYYIKQFLDEKKQMVRIFLDTSLSMLGEADSDKSLAALRMAAAIAYLAVQAMDSVCFYAMNGSRSVPVGPVINCKSQLIATFAELEQVDFCGTCDIGAAIADQGRFGGGRGLTVILSDLQTDSDWKGAIRSLKAKGQDVMLICLLSKGEEQPAYRGAQSLADAELPETQPFHVEVDRDMLHAYEEAVRWFYRDVEAFCAGENVALACVGGGDAPEEVLLQRGFMTGLIK